MHLLTTFPQLLTFGLVAPFLLRVTVAIFILSIGKTRYSKPYSWTAILYIAVGLALLAGIYTQIAAIIGIIIIKFDFYTNYMTKRGSDPITREIFMLYTFAAVILLSLLVTGPGFLAFDLPL